MNLYVKLYLALLGIRFLGIGKIQVLVRPILRNIKCRRDYYTIKVLIKDIIKAVAKLFLSEGTEVINFNNLEPSIYGSRYTHSVIYSFGRSNYGI